MTATIERNLSSVQTLCHEVHATKGTERARERSTAALRTHRLRRLAPGYKTFVTPGMGTGGVGSEPIV